MDFKGTLLQADDVVSQLHFYFILILTQWDKGLLLLFFSEQTYLMYFAPTILRCYSVLRRRFNLNSKVVMSQVHTCIFFYSLGLYICMIKIQFSVLSLIFSIKSYKLTFLESIDSGMPDAQKAKIGVLPRWTGVSL